MFPYNTLLLVVPYQKEGLRATNCQTEFLGYWLQFMTVFETTREEEIKILSSFSSSTTADHQPLPLDSSWGAGGHSSWGMRILCSPFCQLRVKATFLFLPNSVSVFFIRLWRAEKAIILASNMCSLQGTVNEARLNADVEKLPKGRSGGPRRPTC